MNQGALLLLVLLAALASGQRMPRQYQAPPHLAAQRQQLFNGVRVLGAAADRQPSQEPVALPLQAQGREEEELIEDYVPHGAASDVYHGGHGGGGYGGGGHGGGGYGGGGHGGGGYGGGGRVRIKVYRGPTQGHGYNSHAPWGYWVKQPADIQKHGYGYH